MKLTVSEVAALLAQATQQATTEPIWITGTLTSWRRTRTWGQGELASYDHRGSANAKLRIGVPGKVAAALETRFAADGIELAKGLDVEILAKPELHPRYGLRLLVTTMSSDVVISADRLRQEQLLQELQDTGLNTTQQHLDVTAAPHQKLGLISPSGGNAAREDVLTVLRSLDIEPRETRVAMSAPNAEDFIAKAIGQLEPLTDVMLIIRGGGDESDLQVFNERRVVLAVANSSIPIVVGIGHATNNPLINQAAHHAAATPTAAAQWVAENFAGVQPAIPAAPQALAELAPDRPQPTIIYQRPQEPLHINKALVAAVAALAFIVLLLLIF